MDGYIAETRMFAGNFAPRGWAFCNGQILTIAQNTALFALLGTQYGGNGQTTFALPDLRGRAPIGTAQSYPLGALAGTTTVTLLPNNLPPHNHTLTAPVSMSAVSTNANAATPVNNYFANDGTARYDTNSDGITLAPATYNLAVGAAGGSAPVENMMPYTAINYIICLEGIFPSRN